MIMFEKTKHTEYFIDSQGDVYSKSKYNSRGKLKKKTKTLNKKRGYYYVRTIAGNYSVHRLVATAYVPNLENKPCVNHKNSNKLDNRADNLEWVTHKENTRHAIESGRVPDYKNTKYRFKYSDDVCRKVIQKVKSGMTYKQAGETYDMPYSTVAHLIRGSRRRL